MSQLFKRNGRWVGLDEVRAESRIVIKDKLTIGDNECPYCSEKFPSNSHIRNCKKHSELISIIIPCRKGENILTLTSIENQTYKNYEIIVEIDKKSEGAPAMRNKGFKKSNGSLLFFCDNDLDLDPKCLERLYKNLKINTYASYSYGSYILGGKEVEAIDFDPKTLYDHNYISTMSLIRREDFVGFDESLRKYQDWDLWLSMYESGKIGVNSGYILFSTSIRDGISQGKSALDKESARNIIRKKHPPKKLADIIIPHHDRHDLLKKCLDGIDNFVFNVIILSGGSFAHNCNVATKSAQTDTFIFLNDDVEANTGQLMKLAASKFDFCGTSQFIGSVKYYGMHIFGKDVANNWGMSLDMDTALVPSGYCFKCTREAWERLGGFDEEFKNGGEDQDLGLTAIEIGINMGFIDAPMVHKHSQSKGRFDHRDQNKQLLEKKWGKKVSKILYKNNKKKKCTKN